MIRGRFFLQSVGVYHTRLYYFHGLFPWFVALASSKLLTCITSLCGVFMLRRLWRQVNNLRAGETGVEYGSYVNDFQALNPTR